jgi:hypothetical protein
MYKKMLKPTILSDQSDDVEQVISTSNQRASNCLQAVNSCDDVTSL